MSDLHPIFEDILNRARRPIHERIANANPKLSRGLVWCHVCGRCESVNAAECLAHGWPECHSQTMSLDAPQSPQETP